MVQSDFYLRKSFRVSWNFWLINIAKKLIVCLSKYIQIRHHQLKNHFCWILQQVGSRKFKNFRTPLKCHIIFEWHPKTRKLVKMSSLPSLTQAVFPRNWTMKYKNRKNMTFFDTIIRPNIYSTVYFLYPVLFVFLLAFWNLNYSYYVRSTKHSIKIWKVIFCRWFCFLIFSWLVYIYKTYINIF